MIMMYEHLHVTVDDHDHDVDDDHLHVPGPGTEWDERRWGEVPVGIDDMGRMVCLKIVAIFNDISNLPCAIYYCSRMKASTKSLSPSS